MNKLALSIVIVAAVGAGAGMSAMGCTTTSSTGGNDAGNNADVTSGGDDSGSTPDSGTTPDTGTTEDTGTPAVDSGMEAAAMCVSDASLGVATADGGENTTCEMCISNNMQGCANQQCECLTDTNMISDDAGTMTPACGAYAECVYADLSAILLAPDAGDAGGLTAAAAALTQAEMDCKGTFPSASVTLGDSLFQCIGTMCMSCIP